MWDGVDRRKFVRAKYPCLITVRKDTPPVQAVFTHTEDISPGGVRVIIRKKIEVMAEVDLEIDLKDTLQNVSLKGKIARVKEIPATQRDKAPRYDTAIQFIDLKDEDRQRIANIVKYIKS